MKDIFARERTIHFQVEQPIPNLHNIVEQLDEVSLELESGTSFSFRFNRFHISAGEVAYINL